MAAWIPIAVGALAGYLKNRGANKKAEAEAKARQPYEQHALDVSSARNRMAQSIAKAYGVEGAFGPGNLEKLGAPRTASGYNGAGNTASMFGDMAGGVASGMAANYSGGQTSFQDWMKMVNEGMANQYRTPVAGPAPTAEDMSQYDANGNLITYDDDDINSPWR